MGSDHTDRRLEAVDIARSKQICPNVICRDGWPLEDVIEHWDELVIRSEAIKDAVKTPYQEGQLWLILSPSALMEFIRSSIQEPLRNLIVFSGTLTLKNEVFQLLTY